MYCKIYYLKCLSSVGVIAIILKIKNLIDLFKNMYICQQTEIHSFEEEGL